MNNKPSSLRVQKISTQEVKKDSGSLSASIFEYPQRCCAYKGKSRNRKNNDQLKLLIGEFKEHPAWDKSFINGLAEKTGLSFGQIYKWHWDFSKKNKKAQKKFSSLDLTCLESLTPQGVDKDLYVHQKLYSFQFFKK